MSAQLAELTARFNMSDVKRPNVRRCLFGRPDREKLSKDLDRQDKIFEDDAIRFREKWSFDPITGRPLEGEKFQYEVIAIDSSCGNIPQFYTKGYSSSRKSRPARTIRNHGFSDNKPYSAKRKLDLESQENNNENEVVDKRVPNKGDIVNGSDLSLLCMPDTDGNTCCRLSCPLPGGLTQCTTVSSISGLSPTSRNKDIMTPTSRPRSLVQSSMKDYLPNKKQRMYSTKALPRT